MSAPRVSVVIPTYRRPGILSRAVDSVKNQTFDDWELIVVNDAPDCDVRDVLPDDDRIYYHQHERNRGAPTARNTGIDAADGEFIALLDDDDAWKPQKLERQLEQFTTLPEEYGMVYCGREIVCRGEVVETYRPEITGWIFDDLLNGNCIPSETPLIRRTCFDEVGRFDPTFESAQDLDMWLRIAREFKIGAVAEPLAIAYRGHDDRISEDMRRKYRGLSRLLEKYGDEFEYRPKVRAQRYKTLGIYALNADRPDDARTALRTSLEIDLRDALTVVYLFLTVLPGPVRRRIVSLRQSFVEYGVYGGITHWFG